jgi:hypothetical protein
VSGLDHRPIDQVAELASEVGCTHDRPVAWIVLIILALSTVAVIVFLAMLG